MVTFMKRFVGILAAMLAAILLALLFRGCPSTAAGDNSSDVANVFDFTRTYNLTIKIPYNKVGYIGGGYMNFVYDGKTDELAQHIKSQFPDDCDVEIFDGGYIVLNVPQDDGITAPYLIVKSNFGSLYQESNMRYLLHDFKAYLYKNPKSSSESDDEASRTVNNSTYQTDERVLIPFHMLNVDVFTNAVGGNVQLQSFREYELHNATPEDFYKFYENTGWFDITRYDDGSLRIESVDEDVMKTVRIIFSQKDEDWYFKIYTVN